MGTATESFIDLTDRIGRQTGGLSFYPFLSSRRGSTEPVAYLMVRGKAMAEKAPELLDVMRDILLTARLDDKNRFKQVGGQSFIHLIRRRAASVQVRTVSLEVFEDRGGFSPRACWDIHGKWSEALQPHIDVLCYLPSDRHLQQACFLLRSTLVGIRHL